MTVERRRWQLEKLGPYMVGILLLLMCFAMEYTLIVGQVPFTGEAVKPIVPPELLGRIVGTFETFTGLFLAWLYQTSRSSQSKDEALAAAAKPVP